MAAAERDRNRSTPAGIANQRSKAQPRPQISPAPGVVARLANTTPKTSPKSPPSRIPWVSDASSILLCTPPPSAPVTSPSTGPNQAWTDAKAGFCLVNEGCVATSFSYFLLLQINRLHDVSGKEKLDGPIHQHTNLALHPRQF